MITVSGDNTTYSRIITFLFFFIPAMAFITCIVGEIILKHRNKNID